MIRVGEGHTLKDEHRRSSPRLASRRKEAAHHLTLPNNHQQPTINSIMNTEITFPVASILTNTSAIVNACEDLEVSAPSDTLPLILVTQLAALIHEEEYQHARHLWRRYSHQVQAQAQAAEGSSQQLQFQQFTLLWKAVAPLLLLEDITAVYDSLTACTNTQLQPLASYAQQLQQSIRIKLAKAVESVYESISNDYCKTLLGFKNNNGNADLQVFLNERKWTQEQVNGLWIPHYQPVGKSASAGQGGGGGGDRIDYLTKIVGFMETQRLNA